MSVIANCKWFILNFVSLRLEQSQQTPKMAVYCSFLAQRIDKLTLYHAQMISS